MAKKIKELGKSKSKGTKDAGKKAIDKVEELEDQELDHKDELGEDDEPEELDDDGADASDDSDDDDDDSDDDDEEVVALQPKKTDRSKASERSKATEKSKQKPKSNEKNKASAKRGEKDKEVDQVEVKPKPVVKRNPDEVDPDIKEMFGLKDGDATEDPSDYTPEGKAGISFGALFALIIVIAVMGGLVYQAKVMLKERQSEIEARERLAKAEAEASKVPDTRYGNIALMASTPKKALILQNGEPIYAKTKDGVWTELRTGPSSRVQNIKIEEGVPTKFSVVSEGYQPYEISISEYDWVPIPATGDWEKVYNNIKLEPITSPLVQNCAELELLGGVYTEACKVKLTDEISTRGDYELSYATRLTGDLTVESEPSGAKIFLYGNPLIKDDGQQATTPYTFSIYGKDSKGEDKKLKVTGEGTSIRLEMDGMEPYLGTLFEHQWHCAPETRAEIVKVLVVPEKLEETAPNMLQHLCTYTAAIRGKLHKPDPNAKKAEGEAEAPPAEPI